MSDSFDPRFKQGPALRKTDYFGSFLGTLASNDTIAKAAAAQRSTVSDGADGGQATPQDADPVNAIVKALNALHGEGGVKDILPATGHSLGAAMIGIEKLQSFGLATFDGGIIRLTATGKDVAQTLS
jgi:hypothetical protein